MAITYELLESFTGTRTITTPDGDSETINCNDIRVRFTDSETNITYERDVNVVFDEKGDYDATATGERIEEVALGVAEKIKVGLIG